MKTSKYKGVCKERGSWRAAIQIEKKTKFLGYFKDEEEAALAYNKKVKDLRLGRSLNTLVVDKVKLMSLLDSLDTVTIKKKSASEYLIHE